MEQIKYGKTDFDSPLEKFKDECLEKLLHPENKYIEKKP